MNDRQAAGPNIARAREILETTIEGARANDRPDLVERLSTARRLLQSGAVTVHVTGCAPTGPLAAALRGRDETAAGPYLTELPEGKPGTAVAHAAVFVAGAGQELSEPELEQLVRTSRRYPTVVFVLTGIDLAPRWRAVMAADVRRMRARGVRAEPIAVSTPLHEHALRIGDADLEAMSGIPALATRLADLAARPEATSARAVAHHVRAALDAIEAILLARRAALADPARTARLRAEYTHARDRSERFRDRAGRWQPLLSDGFATINSDVDFALRRGIRAVLAAAEEAIDEGDPAKSWDDFTGWLRHRISAETHGAHRLLGAGVRRTGAEITAHLELADGGPDMTPRLPVPRPVTVDVPSPDTAAHTRMPVAARTMGVLMPAYGGVMMSLVLPRYLGLHIPGLVLLGCAVLGALFLGGGAISLERRRQLDKRRTQAKAVVRRYTDEVQLALGKQSRDALRAVQADMRDGYLARVTAVTRVLTEELEAAKRGAREAEQAPQGLADLDDDLASLAVLRRDAVGMLRAAPNRPSPTAGCRPAAGTHDRIPAPGPAPARH